MGLKKLRIHYPFFLERVTYSNYYFLINRIHNPFWEERIAYSNYFFKKLIEYAWVAYSTNSFNIYFKKLSPNLF